MTHLGLNPAECLEGGAIIRRISGLRGPMLTVGDLDALFCSERFRPSRAGRRITSPSSLLALRTKNRSGPGKTEPGRLHLGKTSCAERPVPP